MAKIALMGDAFLDEYYFGTATRLSPEAPVPVLDISRRELRGGGVLNVANNLFALGLDFDTYTIFDSQEVNFPFEIYSPKTKNTLKKTRFIGQLNYPLLRVDTPRFYAQEDLAAFKTPGFDKYDIVAFIDYNKGLIKGGKATIVDSKKRDLGCFEGSEYLKVNEKEWDFSSNAQVFEKAFVTRGPKGIDYYEKGRFKFNRKTISREVIDVTGAGDTVMAVMIYCLANNITDPIKMMDLANKAASIAISKFGTSIVNYNEIFKEG